MKIEGKNWDSLKDEEKISYCNELFNDAKAAREKRDVEWYLNYQFLEGNHYVYYNTVTNSLERLPRRKGEVRAVVDNEGLSYRVWFEHFCRICRVRLG